MIFKLFDNDITLEYIKLSSNMCRFGDVKRVKKFKNLSSKAYL